MASAKPKSAKPNRAPVVEADPAALLPPDLPAECPFQFQWQPAVFTVQAADGINLSAVKDAFKQLHVLSQITLSDLAARLDPADALCAEIASAAAAADGQQQLADGASMPPKLAMQLLQRQFSRDQGLAWKFELVRRRDQLLKAEADAQVAQDVLAGAAAKQAATAARLEAVKARLPQPEVPTEPAPSRLQEPAGDSNAADDGADEAEAGPGVTAAVPALNLQQLATAQEVFLTPEQRRTLAEAQSAQEAAESAVNDAQTSAAAAGAALAAAKEAVDSRFVHYEAYLVEGLASTAAGLSAAITAGIPLRAVLWLHPSPAAANAGTADASAAATTRSSCGGANTRPISGASTRHSTAGGAGIVSAAHDLTQELQQLQDAVCKAAWDSELSGLLVLQVPVEDAASPFTCVPPNSHVTNPAWAAASSAANAAKAAAAAAAAATAAVVPETKQGSSAGAKPAAAAAGPKTSSSGGSQAGGRPGSSVAGSTAGGAAAAAAAAALPEEVLGCKELARALLTIRDQAKRFDTWRNQEAHVYRMPGPRAPSAAAAVASSQGASHSSACMGYYRHLLDSLPPERQSVPLLMHAMLEQVNHNCMSDSAPEAASAAEHAIVTAQLEDAISAAFSSLLDEQSCLLTGPTQEPAGPTLLHRGDILGAAACGLTTGYVAVCGQHGRAAAAPLATSTGTPRHPGDSWGCAARGLSPQDADGIERHMLQLLQLPGRAHAARSTPTDTTASSCSDVEVERKLQQAELRSLCQEVPFRAVQRWQTLQAAANMLPAEVQAAHAADILARYHQEPLQEPHVLRQVLQCSSMELPDAVSSQHQPTGAELVAFFAGPQLERCRRQSMPHAMTFHQYWQLLLTCSCVAPDLQLKVYEMTPAAASQHWQQQLLYTDAGGIATTGTDGVLALHQGATTVRLLKPCLQSSPYELVATFDNGAVVAASALSAPPSSSVHSSNALAAAKDICNAADDVGSGGSGPGEMTASDSSFKGGTDTQQQAAAAVDDAMCATQGGATDPSSGPAPPPAALCVTTPQGIIVQLSTDGCVLLAAVETAGPQVIDASAVDVLGASLAAGSLTAQVAASASAWHAVLPDGTLIKAAAVPRAGGSVAPCAQHTSWSSAERDADKARQPQGLATVLHPDGQVSQQHHLELPLQIGMAAADPTRHEVAGWLRKTPQGEQTWVVDAAALQGLKHSLNRAAQEAAEAVAAAAAEAAAAAAAAEPPSKKGTKGDKKALGKQGSSHPGKQAQEQAPPATPAGPVAADGACSMGLGSSSSGGEQLHTAAAIDAALQGLEQQPPQTMGSIRAVQLTDADTGAVVTTREDHLLIVDYPDGSRLLQDAEGCRVSHVAGTWLFEATGLPAVKGDEQGVTLQPCPGVSLSWSGASQCVTLTHTRSGGTITLLHTGHVAYSPTGQPVEAFLDGCLEVLQQGQHQEQQQAAEAADHLQAASPSSPVQHVLGGAGTLRGLCSQLQCWGVLGLDLMTGEVALHEAGGCRIYVGAGGCIQVWNNGCVEEKDTGAPSLLVAALEDPATDQHGTAAPTTGNTAAAAAEAASAITAPAPAAVDDDDNSGLDDEELAARAAAAAAAAAEQAAAEAAAAAAAAAAAEVAAAVRAAPKPVAASIKPRVFVVDAAAGSGYEILAPAVVQEYAAFVSTQPDHQHLQQELLGAEEPGTICHTFLTTHSCKGRALQPLQLAQPTQVLPMQVDPQQSLVSLRKVQAVVPAQWQAGQGLRLPRVAALNPWHMARAYAGAGGSAVAGPLAAAGSSSGSCGPCIGRDGVPATRLPRTDASGAARPLGGARTAGGQVVVVRDVLQFPELGPEVLAKIHTTLLAWQEQRAQQEQPHALPALPLHPCCQQQQEDADAVSALLEAAGFTPVPPQPEVSQQPGQLLQQDDAAASSSQGGTSAAVALHRHHQHAAAAAGPGRLQQVRGMLLEQRQLAEQADVQAQAEVAASAAAAAAAKQKPYRPWVKPAGPYDHTPQKPEPGQVLPYFSTREGLEAAATDPVLQAGASITRMSLPAAKPLTPASAGKQQVPGVYLSHSTALCGDDDIGCSSNQSASTCHSSIAANPSSSTSTSTRGHSRPQTKAPLMHAGRPLRQQQEAREQQQQEQRQSLHEQQQCALPSAASGAGLTTTGETATFNSSSSSRNSSTSKAPVLDVYGQPRVVLPALPAAYCKDRAPGSLNADYVSREGGTMRATKTSSASLVKASGKEGKQIVLRPAHVHFGNIPVGEVTGRTARLLNGSADIVRFTITRPELPLRVIHKPAPLPPGMEAAFTIELVAEQPGDFVGQVTVKTELRVFTLTVSAKVLPADVLGTAVGAAVGG